MDHPCDGGRTSGASQQKVHLLACYCICSDHLCFCNGTKAIHGQSKALGHTYRPQARTQVDCSGATRWRCNGAGHAAHAAGFSVRLRYGAGSSSAAPVLQPCHRGRCQLEQRFGFFWHLSIPSHPEVLKTLLNQESLQRKTTFTPRHCFTGPKKNFACSPFFFESQQDLLPKCSSIE